MRRCAVSLFQTGVHLPHGVSYGSAAKMKHWPTQSIPENFAFLDEQRYRSKAMPRDTGKIPRDFVLSVLYRHQPCEVSQLWGHCVADPQIVLDSKRHLREVLQQARAEGFVAFEQDAGTQAWLCTLTRERFEDVRAIVAAKTEAAEQYAGLRGAAAAETADIAARFHEMDEQTKEKHRKLLQEEVRQTTQRLRRFQRTEIDYLPYTDLNGRVNFMWWYESSDVTEALPEGDVHSRDSGRLEE